MNKSVEFKGESLKLLANANRTTEVVTTYLALRRRNRLYSDLDTTKSLLNQNDKIEANDYNNYWKSLGKAGIGRYIRGRKGNHDRFHWSYPLKEIAKAAIEGKDVKVAPFLSSPVKAAVNPRKLVQKESVQKRRPGRPRKVRVAPIIEVHREHMVNVTVRPGLTIGVFMPKGFEKNDIQALSEGLKRIAK